MRRHGALTLTSGVIGVALVLAGCGSSKSSSTATPPSTAAGDAACTAIQAKYPSLKGKTVNVGIAPTIPGYETVDPKDPNNLVGFDIDLLKAVSSCAGFSYSFSRADFQTLVPSLQAGRIDMVISNLIASDARAQQVNFVIYQKDEEALIVANGNPKKINAVSDLCGKALAVFPGTVQAGAAETQSQACTASGKQAITINTYADFNGCLQGMLTGRSDAFINPVSVVAESVAKYPQQLSATPPIAEFRSLIGMAFNKSSTDLRDAVFAATKEVQAKGTEKALFTSWQQDPGDEAPASLLP
jgi:polar amino acid transport system substrate-binding protein